MGGEHAPESTVNILLQPKLDLLFIFCILFALTWLIIKPIVVKSSLANKYRKVLLEWKNNPTVFISLLKKQKIVPKEIWDQDFILGNRNAPIQIIAVLNPYCIFCKKVHFELNILLLEIPPTLTPSYQGALTP